MALSPMYGARTAILDGSTKFAGLRGTILRKRSATQYDVALDDGREVTVRCWYCAILADPPYRERKPRMPRRPPVEKRVAEMFSAVDGLTHVYALRASNGVVHVRPGVPRTVTSELIGVYGRDAAPELIAEDCAA